MKLGELPMYVHFDIHMQTHQHHCPIKSESLRGFLLGKINRTRVLRWPIKSEGETNQHTHYCTEFPKFTRRRESIMHEKKASWKILKCSKLQVVTASLRNYCETDLKTLFIIHFEMFENTIYIFHRIISTFT